MPNTSPLKILKRGVRWRSLLKPFRTPTFRAIFLHVMIVVGIFVGLLYFLKTRFAFYPIIAAAIFLLGIVHVWLLYGIHDWAKQAEGTGMKEGILTLGTNLVGTFVAYSNFGQDGTASFFPLAAVGSFAFSIPFAWHRAFWTYLFIPEKEFAPLFIKTTHDIIGIVKKPPSTEGIFFHFNRSIEDKDLPKSLQKTYIPQPKNKHTIDVIFKSLIHDYNLAAQENPLEQAGQQIQFCKAEEDELQYHQWFLYHQPYPFLKIKKIIDPHKTTAANRMRFRKWSGTTRDGLPIKLRVIDIYVERRKAQKI